MHILIWDSTSKYPMQYSLEIVFYSPRNLVSPRARGWHISEGLSSHRVLLTLSPSERVFRAPFSALFTLALSKSPTYTLI